MIILEQGPGQSVWQRLGAVRVTVLLVYVVGGLSAVLSVGSPGSLLGFGPVLLFIAAFLATHAYIAELKSRTSERMNVFIATRIARDEKQSDTLAWAVYWGTIVLAAAFLAIFIATATLVSFNSIVWGAN